MKSYHVYIVQCSDKTYYTGITNNLDRRLFEHNEGINPTAYTFSRRPVVLKYTETFNNPMDAIIFEKKIKNWSRKKKEALIKNDHEEIRRLSLKKR
jgi:putative endonuclease